MYRNEAKVGEAVRESGIPREEIFISTYDIQHAPAGRVDRDNLSV